MESWFSEQHDASCRILSRSPGLSRKASGRADLLADTAVYAGVGHGIEILQKILCHNPMFQTHRLLVHHLSSLVFTPALSFRCLLRIDAPVHVVVFFFAQYTQISHIAGLPH